MTDTNTKPATGKHMIAIPVPTDTQLPEHELQLYLADRFGHAIGRHISAVTADGREYIVQRGDYAITRHPDWGEDYPQNLTTVQTYVVIALKNEADCKVDELCEAGDEWPVQGRFGRLDLIKTPDGRTFHREGRYYRRVA